MPRYAGEPLPSNVRIALIANDALGNFVVATPLAQMLRAQLPATSITFFSGVRTRELQQASDLFDQTASILGVSSEDALHLALQHKGTFDWVINLEASNRAKWFASAIAGKHAWITGPAEHPEGRGDLEFESTSQGELWKDREWISPQITDRHPVLTSGFIGEIFCRLAYRQGPVPGYRVPLAPVEGDVPDVLVATSASLPEKLWPAPSWTSAVQILVSRGLTVGVIGAAPAAGKTWLGRECEDAVASLPGVEDLRGRLTLPQVSQALRQCRQVLTLDNGILHLACASQTPVVGLFREGIHRLWAPPVPNLTVITPSQGQPVSEIPVEAVISACLG